MEINWHVLKEKNALPTHKANKKKVTKTPLFDFVTSSQSSIREESPLLKMCTNDVFDPNACKLMKNFVYDFSKPCLQDASLKLSYNFDDSDSEDANTKPELFWA